MPSSLCKIHKCVLGLLTRPTLTEIDPKVIQSIPKKDLQGFCFQDSHIAFSTHFSWQVEYGRHESGNLVNLFLESTVLYCMHEERERGRGGERVGQIFRPLAYLPSSMTMKGGNDGPRRREPGSLQLARRITRNSALSLSRRVTALSSPEGIMVNI